MSLIDDALRAGHAPPLAHLAEGLPSVVLAGAGGALGSAVLESLLAGRRFAAVRVLVTREWHATMPGLQVIVAPSWSTPPERSEPALARVGVIVFDRERHANGRDLAFARPAPHELPALARGLVQRGVRTLLVVLPHAPSGLPQALKAGLANLDEQAVSALPFEHVLFVRSAVAPQAGRATRWMQRLADGVLAQLQVMVAAQLPLSPPGSRVAPPEFVWQASQVGDPAALVRAWLACESLPPLDAPRLRL